MNLIILIYDYVYTVWDFAPLLWKTWSNNAVDALVYHPDLPFRRRAPMPLRTKYDGTKYEYWATDGSQLSPSLGIVLSWRDLPCPGMNSFSDLSMWGNKGPAPNLDLVQLRRTIPDCFPLCRRLPLQLHQSSPFLTGQPCSPHSYQCCSQECLWQTSYTPIFIWTHFPQNWPKPSNVSLPGAVITKDHRPSAPNNRNVVCIVLEWEAWDEGVSGVLLPPKALGKDILQSSLLAASAPLGEAA